ncbi:MAG: hypothetical protein RTU30_05490 [Candidatus Thorarchaeota archaeon]
MTTLFMKVNDRTVLFGPGRYRANTSDLGNEIRIFAYGEAFVPITDTIYDDRVRGTVGFADVTRQDESVVPLVIAVSGTVLLVATAIAIFLRHRYR